MMNNNDLERRIREIENNQSFLRGALYVTCFAILAYFGYSSFIQIPNIVDKEMDAYFGEKTRTTIDEAKKRADDFLNHGANKVWPDGSYVILKNGPCPIGFRTVEVHAKAFKVFAREDQYIKEGFFGDSFIRPHDAPPKAEAEISIQSCVKD